MNGTFNPNFTQLAGVASRYDHFPGFISGSSLYAICFRPRETAMLMPDWSYDSNIAKLAHYPGEDVDTFGSISVVIGDKYIHNVRTFQVIASHILLLKR